MSFFQAKRRFRNSFHNLWMIVATIFTLSLPILIAIGLYFKSKGLLVENSFWGLLFSKDWQPLAGKFGLYPFIISSLWVTLIALLIAAPICLFSAIHLTQYAKRYVSNIMSPVIDILAGIPSVIFGVWGILVIVPFVSNNIAPIFGKQISGYTILTGGIVLAIIIIPFILNILIELFRAVPEELTEATLALGATRWMFVKRVLLPKTFSGIVSAFGLGLSRAFGETIAVLMVVGNVVRIPTGSLQPGYPLPSLIANNYGEMLSIPNYEAALMLAAFVLLIIVVIFNLIARSIIHKMVKI